MVSLTHHGIVTQQNFETISKGFEFTFSTSTITSLMEPTTPTQYESPGFELVDCGTAACRTPTDNSSASSYLPTESDEDSILLPPSPSLYSANNLLPLSSASSVHAGSSNSPFRESALDNSSDISQPGSLPMSTTSITSWPSTPQMSSAASLTASLKDVQMAASPARSPTRRMLGAI